MVHFQWLALPQLDGALLPRGRPLVLTAHDVLAREPSPAQRAAQRRLYRRMDAVIAHSEHGRRRLIDELGARRRARFTRSPTAPSTHLARAPAAPAAAGARATTERARSSCASA